MVQKEQFGWFFRITAYAQELLDWCDRLAGWPEKVLTMQRNWIGRSEGARILFDLAGRQARSRSLPQDPTPSTVRLSSSLAPEHPLCLELSKGTGQEAAVREFVNRILAQEHAVRTGEETEKEGVFTGAFCVNPLTGRKMPVYVANFVSVRLRHRRGYGRSGPRSAGF